MTNLYRAFGLNIRSAIPIGEFAGTDDPRFDVDVHFGEVPESLNNPLRSRPAFDVTATKTLLRIPDSGRFLIEDGRQITIAPDSNADEKDVRLFLLGSAFGATLMQRGLLPLHASALSNGHESILLCGESGQGKSTTACALLRRGYKLLSDDVCAIEIGQNQALLHPAYPQLKLWDNTISLLGLADGTRENLRRIRRDVEKYAWPTATQFESLPQPVNAVIWLGKDNEKTPHLEQLDGGRAFNAVRTNTYRRGYLAGNALRTHLQLIAGILSHASVYQLARPSTGNSIDAVCNLVESIFQYSSPDSQITDCRFGQHQLQNAA